MYSRVFSFMLLMATAGLLLGGCSAAAGGLPDEPTPTAGSLVAGIPSISELAGSPAAEIPPLPELDPAEIELGRELYEAHCAECHGIDLEGEEAWQSPNDDGSFRAPPHDATGHTWHHGDRVLLETTELGGTRLSGQIGGSSNMPAFGQTLTGSEMQAILAYIKSTWPEDIRLIQWERTILASQEYSDD